MMFRKLLSVAVLTAMFSFALGNTDAEARHCRGQYRGNSWGRSANFGYGNQGYGYGNQNYGYGHQGHGNNSYGHGGYGYGRGSFGYGNRGYGGVSVGVYGY